MPEIVIQIENLSKQYRLGTVGTGTLSHDLNRWWHRLRGKPDPYIKVGQVDQSPSNAKNEESPPPSAFSFHPSALDRRSSPSSLSSYVWALRDINLEVKRGEVLGIIGRNGAGKSTLLKIMSRVTAPTTGLIRAKGRVASLLEVGTGFHPELTGRENIYLNGAILGMNKPEIRSKIDEIVDFSGCKRYIDTPVKRYSSGMSVRLAFAVAAHLDPEILVIDEVLAVGDAQFQKKCIDKMGEVAKGGRTVLFVSHNMSAVNNLCTSAVVIQDGHIHCNGTVRESILSYAESMFGRAKSTTLLNRTDRKGLGDVQVVDVTLENSHGEKVQNIASGEHCRIVCETNGRERQFKGRLYGAVIIRDLRGLRVWTISSEMRCQQVDMHKNESLIFEIPKMPLSEGKYVCDVRIAEGYDTLIQDWISEAFSLEVVGNDYFQTGQPQGINLDVFFADFDFYGR